MKISLSLILDELGYEYDGHARDNANPCFEGIELLTAHDADLSGKKLLVCLLSEALALTDRDRDLHFLCVRDRMVDAQETEETLRGITIIKRNIEMRELFNEVQRIIGRVGNWVMDMQRSVMNDEGVQQLVAMSEAIIGNHIAVMDSTFKLIAHTENVDIDDPATVALIRHGYHVEETMERLLLHRRFEQFEKEEGVIVSDDFAASKYVSVKKIFRYRDSYSVIVVMLCNVRRLSDGLLGLFDMLVSALQVYVNRDYPAEEKSGSANTLISDILEKKIDSEGEVRSRASYAGLPMLSEYDLFLIAFADMLNVPLSRLTQTLTSMIPGAQVLSFHRGIVILNRYEGVRAQERDARLSNVENVLDGLTANCGVSARFEALHHLPVAYRQAHSAIRLGLRLRGRAEVYTDIPDYGNRFYFEDYVLFHQASLHLEQSDDGFRNTFSYRAIHTLADYDRAHGAASLRILHTYLLCERRATQACALLHMHRNTVLYHIRRIEEGLGISLDDPEIRLKLMTGFKVLELESGS